MKSILRLYLTTSKGNDQFLYKELVNFHLKPKFDENLFAFYCDVPMTTMFQIAHKSLITQNMYIQIGKPFTATDQTVFQQKLEMIQFKNYLPLKRGLIQNLTLDILVRKTQYPVSNNAMTSFLHNALQKQIVKREFFRQVLKGDVRRQQLPSYYQMREIVERKWEQDELFREKTLLMLQQQQKQKKLLLGDEEKENSFNQIMKKSSKLPQNNLQLPFNPNLTIYIKKDKARFLLKVNEQPMYKLGWKRRVGWAPVRQSIATAVLFQSNLLNRQKQTIIWDPFCGSGTFGLVSAAIHNGAYVRLQESNFNWHHWPIFKKQYLQHYFNQQKQQKKDSISKLKLVCTDINFKAANNTVKNLRQFAQNLQPNVNVEKQKKQINNFVRRIRPTEHWVDIMNGEWVVGCGDFEKLSQNILLSDQKVNIITNLPYFKARSADHMPLSQLLSVYKRFSRMIRKNKQKISNVFILIDNNSSNISHPNHFLSISQQKWMIINSFQSGGMPVGLYAWSQNQSQVLFQDSSALIDSLKQQIRVVNNVPDQQLSNALTKYRRKVAEVEKKLYFLPQHLKKIKRGWRRVKEKRRRRHLLRAYDIFARKRDKMIAFTQYAQKKLEIKMLKRGAIWRQRNMKLLGNTPIQTYQKQLKKRFQSKIEQALKKNEQRQEYRRKKSKEANQMIKNQNKSKQKQQNKVRRKIGKKGR